MKQTKKFNYRKAKKGVAEQYGMNISMDIIKDMKITPENREIEVEYDNIDKVIKIYKKGQKK